MKPVTWQSSINDVIPKFIYLKKAALRNETLILPRIIKLLERDYHVDEPDTSIIGSDSGVSIQSVILTDEGEALSSPDRIIELLHSVSSIYSVIAETHGVPQNSLAVVGMDSGSEKSFDFLGIAKVMHELRETLQWAYNSIVFHRHNITLKNLQIAGETLSVVQKIGKLESTKAITAEEAARMRHGLFSGLEKFTLTGAYTPEMNVARTPPALAMRPQPRLLTANAEELVREANDANIDQNADGKPMHPGLNVKE